MSATGRGTHRIANDGYNTPDSAILPLLDLIYVPHVSTFLEPCRGNGAIYDKIHCHRRYHAEIAEGTDYLSLCLRDKVNLIITNPPFKDALSFLEKSLSEADTVAYLLRLNFLSSVGRKAFWNENRPTHLLALAKRPCFVWTCKGHKVEKGKKEKGCGALYHPGYSEPCEVCGGRVAAGTDACDYGWFIWDRAGLIKAASGVDSI